MQGITLPEKFIAQVWCGSDAKSVSFRGTCFFIGEQLILTCLHVIKPYPDDSNSDKVCNYIEIRSRDGLIRAEHKTHRTIREYDIAILELDIAHPERVLPILVGVTRELKASWLGKGWHTHGYPANSRGSRSETCQLVDPTSHIDDGDAQYPTRVQAGTGSIARGCSGSPICLFDKEQWIYTGILYRAGEGTRFCEGYSSDVIYHSLTLEEQAQVKVRKAQDCCEKQEVVSPDSFRSAVSVQPSSVSVSEATSAAAKKYRKDIAVILSYLFAVVLIMVGMVAWGISNKSREELEQQVNIAVAPYAPDTGNSSDSKLAKLIQDRIQTYVREHVSSSECGVRVNVIPLSKEITTKSEAAEAAEKYSSRLVIWGDYLVERNAVTIRTHTLHPKLSNTETLNTQKLPSLSNVLSDSLELIIGKSALALIHLEIGVSNAYNNINEARKHLQRYEQFDRAVTDPEALLNKPTGQSDFKLAVAHVYNEDKLLKADKILASAYDDCSPEDENCKAYVSMQRGCGLRDKNEIASASQFFDRAAQHYREANDTLGVASQICNKASLYQHAGSLSEALQLWDACEKEVDTMKTPDDRARTLRMLIAMSRGSIYRLQCKDEAAREELKKVKLAPDTKDLFSYANYNLALVEQKAENTKKAFEYVSLALKHLPPDSPISVQADMKSLKGDLEHQQGQYFYSSDSKAQAGSLYMRVGYNPVNHKPCREREAKCSLLHALVSAHRSASAEKINQQESKSIERSPCNGILQCFSEEWLYYYTAQNCDKN